MESCQTIRSVRVLPMLSITELGSFGIVQTLQIMPPENVHEFAQSINWCKDNHPSWTNAYYVPSSWLSCFELGRSADGRFSPAEITDFSEGSAIDVLFDGDDFIISVSGELPKAFATAYSIHCCFIGPQGQKSERVSRFVRSDCAAVVSYEARITRDVMKSDCFIVIAGP